MSDREEIIGARELEIRLKEAPLGFFTGCEHSASIKVSTCRTNRAAPYDRTIII